MTDGLITTWQEARRRDGMIMGVPSCAMLPCHNKLMIYLPSHQAGQDCGLHITADEKVSHAMTCSKPQKKEIFGSDANWTQTLLRALVLLPPGYLPLKLESETAEWKLRVFLIVIKLFGSWLCIAPDCMQTGSNQHRWLHTPALPSGTAEETPGTVSLSKV